MIEQTTTTKKKKKKKDRRWEVHVIFYNRGYFISELKSYTRRQLNEKCLLSLNDVTLIQHRHSILQTFSY